LNRALELDPLSLPINTNAGYPDYFTHNYQPAIEAFRRAVQIDPSFAPVHEDLMTAYQQMGAVSDSMNEGVRLLELSGDPVLAHRVSEAFHSGGRNAALQIWVDTLLQRSKTQYVSPVAIAQLYIRLGEKEKAIEWLRNAVSVRSQQLVYLKTEPLYDSLRADPRFRELLKKVGLT
jgi:tetratricopeptide (TPR) repeat protein